MFFRRSILDLYVKFSVSRELCSSLVSFILFVLVYPICNSPPSVLPVSMLCHLLHCTCSTSSLVDSSCELLSLYALTMHTPSPRSPLLLSESIDPPAPLFLEFLHLVDVQPSASVSLFLSLLTLPYHPIYSASFIFFSCHDVYANSPTAPFSLIDIIHSGQSFFIYVVVFVLIHHRVPRSLVARRPFIHSKFFFVVYSIDVCKLAKALGSVLSSVFARFPGLVPY